MQIIIARQTAGQYLKGDPIDVWATGSPWSERDQDVACRVFVPDLPMADYLYLAQPWTIDLDYEVVASDPATDTYRLRVFSTSAAGGNGVVTLAQVQAFVESWGGTVVSAGPNEVVFDVSIFGAICTTPFWNRDVTGAAFVEESYTQATGVHRVSIDYTGIAKPTPNYVERWAVKRGATVVSHSLGTLVCDIERSLVRSLFQSDIAGKSKIQVMTRRYYFGGGAVDAICLQPESTMQVTEAQIATYLHDRASE